MVAWWSWLLPANSGVGTPPLGPEEDLRALKVRRRELLDYLSSLRAHGFDLLAQDDEADLKSIERKILMLQLRQGVSGASGDSSSP